MSNDAHLLEMTRRGAHLAVSHFLLFGHLLKVVWIGRVSLLHTQATSGFVKLISPTSKLLDCPKPPLYWVAPVFVV